MLGMMQTPANITGPINIGNPVEVTMLELSERIISLTGSKSKLCFKPLPQDDPKQRQPDISFARSVLKWEPKVTLEDGLKTTIDYFRRTL